MADHPRLHTAIDCISTLAFHPRLHTATDCISALADHPRLHATQEVFPGRLSSWPGFNNNTGIFIKSPGVGYDSVDRTAVSRTEGRQSRGPGNNHREIYLPQLGNPAIRVHVCMWLSDISDRYAPVV